MAPQYAASLSLSKILTETRTFSSVAYFTHDTIDYLQTISDIPDLARIEVPAGKYRSARHNTGKHSRAQREERSYPHTPQYAPYPSPPRIVPQRIPPGSYASGSPPETDRS